jgi:hypothetical protein
VRKGGTKFRGNLHSGQKFVSFRFLQNGNGAHEEIAIKNRINPGGRTRVIDLRGRDRVIENVEVWYARAKYDSAKPKLRLFGLP